MAGQLTIDTLRAGSGVLATQNGMTGIAKAWCQFNGSTGTIAGSFNVGSITISSTGQFVVNFTTSMANTGYSVVASGQPAQIICGVDTYATGTVKVYTFDKGGNAYFASNPVNVIVCGN